MAPPPPGWVWNLVSEYPSILWSSSKVPEYVLKRAPLVLLPGNSLKSPGSYRQPHGQCSGWHACTCLSLCHCAPPPPIQLHAFGCLLTCVLFFGFLGGHFCYSPPRHWSLPAECLLSLACSVPCCGWKWMRTVMGCRIKHFSVQWCWAMQFSLMQMRESGAHLQSSTVAQRAPVLQKSFQPLFQAGINKLV